MARAGPVPWGGWRLGAARFGTTENHGWLGALRIYRVSRCDASSLGRCDSRHKFNFRYPIIFWTPRNQNSNAQSRSPLGGSFAQIEQDCAGCCPDCKQNCSCPCHRTSSDRKPWSRFAFGLFISWFEISFDPFQVLIECDHLRS
jgi:hypothetical protein